MAMVVQTLPSQVILLVDELERDPGLEADVSGGVWVERHELGGLVLYEISSHGDEAVGCLPSLNVELAQ